MIVTGRASRDGDEPRAIDPRWLRLSVGSAAPNESRYVLALYRAPSFEQLRTGDRDRDIARPEIRAAR
jgi:hypothetical protein